MPVLMNGSPRSPPRSGAELWQAAKLSTLQSENRRLVRETTKLKQELANVHSRLRSANAKVNSQPTVATANAAVQCSIPIVSNQPYFPEDGAMAGATRMKPKGSKVNGRKQSDWLSHGGSEIEKLVESGAIVLLNAERMRNKRRRMKEMEQFWQDG